MPDVNVDTLARTIYGEARGESALGRQAVANVVMNRVALADVHPHFGLGSVASACKAPGQFSCWSANDPNLFTITHVNDGTPLFAECLDIAQTAVDGQLDDATGGATYYANLDVCTPPWLGDATETVKIGKHTFFKDVA